MGNRFLRTHRRLAWFLTGLLWVGWTVPETVTAHEWTQFEMNRKDAHGDYLWTTHENWTKGVHALNSNHGH